MTLQRILQKAFAQIISAGALLAIAITQSGCTVQISSISSERPSLELLVSDDETVTTGTWTAQLENARSAKHGPHWYAITIRTRRNESAFTMNWSEADFPQFVLSDSSPWPATFEHRTPAGTFQFQGDRSGSKASGSFTFLSDANYVKRVERDLTAPPSKMELLRLGLAKVSSEEIAAFNQTGSRFNAAEILSFKAHGVTSDFVSEVRKAQDFSAHEIVKLRTYGVPGEFPVKLKSAGYRFDAEDIVHLRTYSADEIRELWE